MKRAMTYAAGIAVIATVAFFAMALNLAAPGKEINETLPAAIEVAREATTTPAVPAVIEPAPFNYIEMVGGCDHYFNSSPCINVRSGPSLEFPVVNRLRKGVVLKVDEEMIVGEDGSKWYKVIFDSYLRHPARVNGGWYISAELGAVRPFYYLEESDHWVTADEMATTSKKIIVDLSEEMLYAYDGEELFMKEHASAGLELTPTPRGIFHVFYKTPSRYMQGPIDGISDQYYDLPGVPWNLYFTPEGAVIHGAYWHNSFGQRWSHGCVNLFPENAGKLYLWAELGTTVIVQD